MTRMINSGPTLADLHEIINGYIDSIKEDLWALNKQIHDNPETAFKERKTHDAITKFLSEHRCPVTPHAYGLATAFEARSGESGRLVNFNAEYDALPDLGHACGHNLICISSVAAYYVLSRFLADYPHFKGRVQLLGTPAEEAGGGKIILLERGAYDGVDVSLMAHPSNEHAYTPPYKGISGQASLAKSGLSAIYTGRSAHAAANPWDGINALDAVVSSYNNISLLRQQLRPDERIHGAITQTPRITNAIPEHTAVKYTLRASHVAALAPLSTRVQRCLEAGALATGCSVDIHPSGRDYADVRPNATLARAFAKYMDTWGVALIESSAEPISASTDMGNVTHAVPGLHAIVGIPADSPEAFPHNHLFAAASGTRGAFERFVDVARGLAAVGVRVWSDELFWKEVVDDFGRGKGGEEAARVKI